MKEILKNKWFFIIAFACYEIMVLYIFGIQNFWNFEHAVIPFAVLLGLFVLFQFLLSYLFDKFIQRTFKDLSISFSYLLTGVVVGFLSWILFKVESEVFFSYFTAFVVSAFFPTLVFYIQSLFKHTLTSVESLFELTIENQAIENSEKKEPIFQLENTAGKVILQLKMSSILCFEANDNYVNIYYLNSKEEVGKNMERISLRKVESMIPEEMDNFSRVHKSFIINVNYVERIVGKAQAYRLHLKGLKLEIPVSRSYDVNELKLATI
jgi:hypothetical protein